MKSLHCLHWNIQFSSGTTQIDACLVPFLLTFLKTINQVMQLCKSFWVALIYIYIDMQTFSFVVTYEH